MRRLGAIVVVTIAIGLAGLRPASSQVGPPPPPPVTTTTTSVTTTRVLTPLAWYAAGGFVCAAVSPMIGTVSSAGK